MFLQTQPVPNPIAYFMHQEPEFFHKFEVLSNHFVELIAPFFLFLTRRFRLVGGFLQVLFQVKTQLCDRSSVLVFVSPAARAVKCSTTPRFYLIDLAENKVRTTQMVSVTGRADHQRKSVVPQLVDDYPQFGLFRRREPCLDVFQQAQRSQVACLANSTRRRSQERPATIVG